MGYSFQIAARVLLYTPSHMQQDMLRKGKERKSIYLMTHSTWICLDPYYMYIGPTDGFHFKAKVDTSLNGVFLHSHYKHANALIHMHIHTYAHACTHSYICTYTNAHMQTCTHIYTHMHTCTHVHIYTHTHVNTHTHTQTH